MTATVTTTTTTTTTMKVPTDDVPEKAPSAKATPAIHPPASDNHPIVEAKAPKADVYQVAAMSTLTAGKELLGRGSIEEESEIRISYVFDHVFDYIICIFWFT